MVIIIWATSWENLFIPYANNKAADQPVHPRSLISTFVVGCLDSIIPLVSISEISSLYLVSMTAQTVWVYSSTLNPEDRFSQDVAHWRRCQMEGYAYKASLLSLPPSLSLSVKTATLRKDQIRRICWTWKAQHIYHNLMLEKLDKNQLSAFWICINVISLNETFISGWINGKTV